MATRLPRLPAMTATVVPFPPEVREEEALEEERGDEKEGDKENEEEEKEPPAANVPPVARRGENTAASPNTNATVIDVSGDGGNLESAAITSDRHTDRSGMAKATPLEVKYATMLDRAASSSKPTHVISPVGLLMMAAYMLATFLRSQRPGRRPVIIAAITVTMIAYATAVGHAVYTQTHPTVGELGITVYLVFLSLCAALCRWSAHRLKEAECFNRELEAEFRQLTKDLALAELGPKSMKCTPLVQGEPGDEEQHVLTVLFFVIQAENLSSRFKVEVLAVLASAADPGNEVVTVVSIKSQKRAEEKSQLDCGGDPTKVFDYLRATVVATTMAEVRRMWDKVTELTAQGLIEVMQIDNGLRGAPSGYRDINIHLKFGGHVCEVQIVLAAVLVIKQYQTPISRLVSSFEVEQEAPNGTTLADLARACSPASRRTLGVLRFFVAAFCLLLSALYISFGVLYDIEATRYIGAYVFGDVKVPGLVCAVFLAPPFALVGITALSDLLRQVATTNAVAPLTKRAIQATVGGALFLITSVFVAPFLTYSLVPPLGRGVLFGVIFVWTPGAIAIAWAMVPSDEDAARPIKPSRAMVLYVKHFGLNGKHLAFKVEAWELTAVVLQSWTKLPLLGVFVSVHPRIGPLADLGVVEYYDKGGVASAPIFWVILAALVVNAIVPAVLLTKRQARVRRAFAVVEASLDLIYSTFFTLTMLLSGCLSAALPITPLKVISLLSPTAHVFFVCREIETAAADLKVRKRRGTVVEDSSFRTAMALTGHGSTSLPPWKGARFALIALGAVTLTVFVRCADRYPLLSAIPGTCAPCVCNEAGVLQGCPYHAEFNDPCLWISGRGVTAVEKDAFELNAGATSLIRLDHNELETLPADVFDALQNSVAISMFHNRLTELPSGIFDKLASLRILNIGHNLLAELPLGIFDKLDSLISLHMMYNRLEELPVGLLDKLSKLQALSLQGNHIRNISTETFRGLSELTGVDLSSNNISHPVGLAMFTNAKLGYVSLAHNAIRSVEPGAFGQSLEHVWLTGNNLTCSRLVRSGALPRGSGCTDDGVCRGVLGMSLLGNGYCNEVYDKSYNTGECLWDGGDCE